MYGYMFWSLSPSHHRVATYEGGVDQGVEELAEEEAREDGREEGLRRLDNVREAKGADTVVGCQRERGEDG